MSSLLQKLLATVFAVVGFSLSGFTTYAVLESLETSATSAAVEQVVVEQDTTASASVQSAAPNTRLNPVHTKFSAEQIAVVEDLAKQYRDSVFIVYTDDGSQGSGFLVAEDIVITNHHVVSSWDGTENTRATIKTRDGRRLSATYVTGDANVDVAVLRLDEPLTGVKTLSWSSTSPAVGETVMYVGNPSIVGGWFVGIGSVTDYQYNVLLTDLPIASGASGSPILNMKGEIVSIASGIYDIPELRPISEEIHVHEVIPANPVRNAGGSEVADILNIIGGSY